MTWLRWLRQLSLPALRHQAGRQLLALLAVMLGVALPYAVHLINAAALGEFAAAARSIEGQPDLILSRQGGTLDLALFERIAAMPEVLVAAPQVEAAVQMRGADGKVHGLRLLGIDALAATTLSPDLLARPPADESPLQLWLDPQRLHLNRAAAQLLDEQQALIELRHTQGLQLQTTRLQRGGQVEAGGGPLAVIDIAGAQVLLGRMTLDQMALRLQAGVTAEQFLTQATLPSGVRAVPPSDAGARLASMTQAYRVNLGVLSLMALFTGSFLVFAVVSLSVAQRQPQLALLGVLGLSGRERAGLVMAEAALLGLLGSGLGLLLGWELHATVLKLLGGDLGATLGISRVRGAQLEQLPLLVFGLLGFIVCLLAAAAPALAVREMPVAQVLKGLGGAPLRHWPFWLGPGLLLLALPLALAPPWHEMSLGAYAAMLLLLLGGMLSLPQALALLLKRPGGRALAQLARARLREHSGDALQTLSGVLVALALSVAMLVMVGSFRESLQQWLTQMLPAELYLRSGLRGGAVLTPELVAAIQQSPLIERNEPQRSARAWHADTGQEVALQARAFDPAALPLVGAWQKVDRTAVYINEAMRDEWRLQAGQGISLRLMGGARLDGRVAGIWRDYSRQTPALLLPLSDYRRVSGDLAVSELLLWPKPGAEKVTEHLRSLAPQAEDIEIASASDLRSLSLRIFDRSFVLTHGLQAVALAIGLFGIAASQSAQTLARRREFGLLRHLGLARGDILRLLLREAALLAACGTALGLLLGLAISAVLVWVLNPQSFHWSMEMHIPWLRLLGLLAAVFLTAIAAALLAGRQALSADAVQSVKEDW
ncbi:FtsX-like permease family protein [Roseateles microcysteis]|uniref:FtsX-like permease family protein n=1 Tax=Roseateles microcysteis TaxID=3119057 RepID=UPI002FE6A777